MRKAASVLLRILPLCLFLISIPAYSVQKAKVTAEMATILKNKDDPSSAIADVKKGDVLIAGNKSFGEWIRVVAPGSGAPSTRIGWLRTSDLEIISASTQITEPKKQVREEKRKKETSPTSREAWNKTYLAGFFDLAILSPSSLQEASGYTTGFAIGSNLGFELGKYMSPQFSAGIKFDILSLSATGFATGGKIFSIVGDYTLSESASGKRDFSIGGGLGYLFGGSISGEVGSASTTYTGPSFSAVSLLFRIQKHFELSEQFFFKLNFAYRYISSKTVVINEISVKTQQGGPLLGFGIEYLF